MAMTVIALKTLNHFSYWNVIVLNGVLHYIPSSLYQYIRPYNQLHQSPSSNQPLPAF